MKINKKIFPVARPDLTGKEKYYLNEAFASSWISSKGEYIDKFEIAFAKFIGCHYALSTSNGTTALHLALVALGIGKDQEVLVPDLTFIACPNSVFYTGARPVLIDTDKKNWNINLEDLEKKISKKTTAIMAVHLYGIPCDMESIMILSQKYKLKVIEDAAEAHGSEVKIGKIWKKTGSIGHVGCFSFFGNKIITTGEGGMVTTNDQALFERMKILRDHGQDPDRRYCHPVIGFNYRMTNLAAAIGLGQLERIQKLINAKKEIARHYLSCLKGIPGITFPEFAGNVKPVNWLFSVIIDKPFKLNRNQLMEKLQKNGIETRPFFVPVHRQPPYYNRQTFPNADYFADHGINLPSGYFLEKNDIKYICQSILD